MNTSKRHALRLALFAITLVAAPISAPAQTWPQRPVRFIIPFGPGAGADIGARLIQEKLSTRWGKPVVIDNRPGGDSIIAIQAVLSANDDHTFLWGPSGNFIVHPYLYQKLPYNPDDILPIREKVAIDYGNISQQAQTIAVCEQHEQLRYNRAGTAALRDLFHGRAFARRRDCRVQ